MFSLIHNKNIFFLLIIFTQIYSIKSETLKCYSVPNCETCPELDYCEKCLNGFTLNKEKTDCYNKTLIELNNNTYSSNLNDTQQKKLDDIFKNIPFKSIEEAKQRDLRRVKINRLLVFILILLVISIIISTAYDIYKKFMIRGYSDDVPQEENSKINTN